MSVSPAAVLPMAKAMIFGGAEDDLPIRSRYGIVRDLIPIYSLYQLIPNLVAVVALLGLIYWLGEIPPFLLLFVMIGWVCQFVARPSVMTISTDQAAWLEAVLAAQGFYGQSELDGRWRLIGAQWWEKWPHHCIAFEPGDSVTVIAPRDVMASLRDSLELVAEHGELYFAEGQPFTFEPPEPAPDYPWHMHVPAALLGSACVVAFFWLAVTSGAGLHGGERWGLSAAALSQSRFETIFLHMFAHGSAAHLMMNMSALVAIGAPLTARLGAIPLNWLRFLLLFYLSALAGAALYLSLHPMGTVPMVGASGGIYGLIGLLVRTPADGGALLSVKSIKMRRIGWDLVKQNAFLFVMLALMAWVSGTAGGLAWEAHLGGFLFGLCLGPKLLPRQNTKADTAAQNTETLATTG